MNTTLTKRSICAIALGGWTAFACALSLGPVTGSTVVGRPLAVTAAIQFDEPAGSGSGCVSADVLYGDQRVDSARVRVDVTPDAAGQLARATITSAAVVDEPFVTLVLRAGCSRPVTRRYVLLADAPRDEPVILGAATTLARATPLPSPEPAARTAPAAPVAAAKAPLRTAAPVTARAPRVAAPAPARPRPPAAQDGRLQLAVWDPNAQPMPWLRVSTRLDSAPTLDAAQRAAATALWRALNAQPQDLLRTAERLRGLEAEMGALRGLADRHRSELRSASESLQSARSQRHLNLLVVTLLALLAGSAAAYFWHRTRHADARTGSADSWYGPLEPVGAGPVREVAVAVVEEEHERQSPPVPPGRAPLVRAAVPEPRPALSPFVFARPEAAATPAPAPVLPHDAASLKVDALHGAQQQSEFFASLGQVEEAVSVLASYLEESREKPVLAFLELFRIYHGAGLRMEYELLQATFRQTFGMDVATFGEYRDEHRELELYLVPVTRIAAAWPSERSLAVIEELLFARPATPRDLLSLDAYRELLWLYGLGQEIVYSTGAPAGISILPWAAGQPEGPAELSLDRLTGIDVASGLDAFGVDIDLGAMRSEPAPPAAPEPLPVITPPPPDPGNTLDAFDAVMEAESRRHHR